MLKQFSILALLLLTPTLSIAAEDAGLYPDAPPADVAFVRVVNTSDAMVNDITLSGISLGDVDPKSVTEYAVLTQGDAEIKIGDASFNQTLVAGDYYTASMVGENLTILNDHKIDTPTKAVIALYNFSDIENISLVSTTHNADIFKDVSSGQKDARDINAVSIGIAVKNGDAIIAEMADVKLERQTATSLILIGSDGAYDVLVKNNKAFK